MPKAKKGKKKKGEVGPEIRTTMEIINERSKMFCPRLGDNYARTIKVEEILQDVVLKTIDKCITKQQDNLNLAGMRLSKLPNLADMNMDLYNLVDINLSRNQLFNGHEVFKVLKMLIYMYITLTLIYN
jgi:hypothetical protein